MLTNRDKANNGMAATSYKVAAAEKRAQLIHPPKSNFLKRKEAALIISKSPHGLFLAVKYHLPQLRFFNSAGQSSFMFTFLICCH